MPILDNPRWERFAQEVAIGTSRIDAYEKAGYARNGSAGSILASKQEIKDRVHEIRVEISEGSREVANKAAIEVVAAFDEGDESIPIAQRLGITQAYLLSHLRHNIVQAQDAGQYAAANKAIELLLKVINKGDIYGGPDADASAAGIDQTNDNLAALLAIGEKLAQGPREAKGEVNSRNRAAKKELEDDEASFSE